MYQETKASHENGHVMRSKRKLLWIKVTVSRFIFLEVLTLSKEDIKNVKTKQDQQQTEGHFLNIFGSKRRRFRSDMKIGLKMASS